MPAKLTKELFVIKANNVHHNNYDYSKFEYISTSTAGVIICKKHGEFLQKPEAHLQGRGCFFCKRKQVKDSEMFVKELKEKFGDRYDYLNVIYKGVRIPVELRCKKHGSFWNIPNAILNMRKEICCPHCIQEEKIKKMHLRGQKNFIQRVIKIVGCVEKDIIFISNKRLKIKCPTHGWFIKRKDNLFQGFGCIQCAKEKARKKAEIAFLEKAKHIHLNKYDYSLVKYVSSNTKVVIICKKHGSFNQTPDGHINLKQGCPKCRLSKGEIQIDNFLSDLNINFIRQHSFSDCKYKRSLKFDFYLPDFNMCIEFDGQQHFNPWYQFGIENGNKVFVQTKKYDLIKTNYCAEKGIRLVRIKYDENIQTKLINTLNS